MSVDDDDDLQSFYSMLPDGSEAPPEEEDVDWSEGGAAEYYAQPWPTARTITSSNSSTTEAEEHSTTIAKEVTVDSSIFPAAPGHAPHLRVESNPGPLQSQRHLAASNAPGEAQTRSVRKRPSTSGGERKSTWNNAETPLNQQQTRRKTLTAQPERAFSELASKLNGAGAMNGFGNGRDGDLILELANDQADMEDKQRPNSHGEPLQSRLSSFTKSRSVAPENGRTSHAERRPMSSGRIFGRLSTPRVDSPSEIDRHVSRYGSSKPSRPSLHIDDAASVSSASRSGVFYRTSPAIAEHHVEPMRSSDLPQYGRRRPSFGNASRPVHNSQAPPLQNMHDRSTAEASEQKRSLPDSASVDSQTADTVWDELDDLKSRIKKLGLTGKLPQTSGAAVSAEQNERPRTATTAPTTIASSPKHSKPESQQRIDDPELEPMSPQISNEVVVGGPDAANIHPNLHMALAKAKTILSTALYRSLEATAADALQLALMTGSAGPQGTALTAAAIINGVTVADRHVRRKADTMCRNLTDLVLALCEGKSEASHLVSSPITVNTPISARSPSLRHSRSSLEPPDSLVRNKSRPMSRLEARRTSVFGSQAGSSLAHSPLESGEDISASELESIASHQRPSRDSFGQGRAVSRLQAARLRRFDEGGEDEDPTVRPISRAATDVGLAKSFNSKRHSTPLRSPSFREHLAARRTSQEGASLASESGRSRRFLDPSTPHVVLEEDGVPDDASSVSLAKRRITSLDPYSSRRSVGELPSRTSSLHQRRHPVLVE